MSLYHQSEKSSPRRPGNFDIQLKLISRNWKCVVDRTAAEAALARIQGQKTDTTNFNTSLAAIRAQVQRELEAERKVKTELEKQSSQEQNQPKILGDQHNVNLAAHGVYFR